MPVSGQKTITVACPRVRDELPKRADATCVWSSSRQPRWQPTRIHIGRQNWLVCNLASDATRPLLPLHENCLLRFGIFWLSTRQIASLSLTGLPRSSSSSPTNLEKRIAQDSLLHNSFA